MKEPTGRPDMVHSPTVIEKILLDPPASKIYSRLGYRRKLTSLSPARKEETDRYIEEAAALISLQGAFMRLPIRETDGRVVRLSGGLCLESTKVARFLTACTEAVFMAATSGNAVMESIKNKTNEDNLTAAVVYDATASEMTDAALDWLMSYINGQLRREGKQLLKRRFSAGYGDFALSNQKEIFEKLQLERIGVALTPSFLLIPEKSVTAVGGISG
ncbi:MAG: methionine synthase [Deltaproteobacteria bacterium]|nr:methionine synthase [Deltaproteobacteria bacterium]